jgi:formate/nitrite transporter FocA (FNT family)
MRNIFILSSILSFMEVGITLFIVAILVIAIWIIFEMKRFKHKLFAIILIALILFTYVGFNTSLKNEDIDFTTSEGLTRGSKLYFSWLTSVVGNLKLITANSIQMDWTDSENKTSLFSG